MDNKNITQDDPRIQEFCNLLGNSLLAMVNDMVDFSVLHFDSTHIYEVCKAIFDGEKCSEAIVAQVIPELKEEMIPPELRQQILPLLSERKKQKESPEASANPPLSIVNIADRKKRLN